MTPRIQGLKGRSLPFLFGFGLNFFGFVQRFVLLSAFLGFAGFLFSLDLSLDRDATFSPFFEEFNLLGE